MTRSFISSCLAGLLTLLAACVGPAVHPPKGETIREDGPPRATPEEYEIGVEDVIEILVWKNEALSRTVPVRPDGRISLPLIDEVGAAGKTPAQLKAEIIERLKRFMADPDVTVIVREVNSRRVYVIGEVTKPGTYSLKSRTTLLELVSLVGGFTEWAASDRVLLVRKNGVTEERLTIDLKKLLAGKDGTQNVPLRSGDVLIVPRKGPF